MMAVMMLGTLTGIRVREIVLALLAICAVLLLSFCLVCLVLSKNSSVNSLHNCYKNTKVDYLLYLYRTFRPI